MEKTSPGSCFGTPLVKHQGLAALPSQKGTTERGWNLQTTQNPGKRALDGTSNPPQIQGNELWVEPNNGLS